MVLWATGLMGLPVWWPATVDVFGIFCVFVLYFFIANKLSLISLLVMS